MTIGISSSGDFRKTMKFLSQTQSDLYRDLDRYGQMGVEALAAATPVDTGATAASWTYEVINSKGQMGVAWYNTNTNRGANIAILLQYGHGTGTGGWVAGYDYINPAIRPVFDRMADDIWKKVKNG